MRRIIPCLLIVALLLPLTPARARERAGEKSTPDWVPLTVIGLAVVGGTIYAYNRWMRERPEPLTPSESTRRLVDPVATPEERDELRQLSTPEELRGFLDRFFLARDPSPGTPANEFREEYERRCRLADSQFPEGDRRSFSDRGRVLILFGPPEERISCGMMPVEPGAGRTWKTVEFWTYAHPAGGTDLPEILRDPGLFERTFGAQPPVRGQMLFVFADRTGTGAFDQVFSTEPGERLDGTIYGWK